MASYQDMFSPYRKKKKKLKEDSRDTLLHFFTPGGTKYINAINLHGQES